ncbi:Thymidylate kinase [Amycolatopsis marina]|uniref:Thymidylate kinase n=1 Tax=Amycolatopsis marina TaxID=490629 RepID=A0A1I1CFB3_9PSEU|nr:dTMP kinase [Amycolatopsis marina]SFB59123.1 Thymidylate kinase [Amycolatopsis marina]
MLVSFEGQDGAGKSSLLRAVFTELTKRGVAAVAVDEFSDSRYGQRLVEALGRDKFLRPTVGEPATMLTRALEVVADLYYFDERVIGPALEAGNVVLKDRHLDTVISTLVPSLVQTGAIPTDVHALTWLSVLLGELRHPPTVTVYVDPPLDVRVARIRDRQQRRTEARGNHVSDEDFAVFAARARVMQQLIAAEPDRFITVINSNRELDEGVRQVVARIDSWRHKES